MNGLRFVPALALSMLTAACGSDGETSGGSGGAAGNSSVGGSSSGKGGSGGSSSGKGGSGGSSAGTSSTGGSSPGNGDACGAYCDKAVQTGCENESASTCTDGCEAAIEAAAPCGAEWEALTACYGTLPATAWTCDEFGNAVPPSDDSCETEFFAFLNCS